MAIQTLEHHLQTQQHKVSEHKRYLSNWFNRHVVLITAGIFSVVVGIAYTTKKIHIWRRFPAIFMQAGQLLLVSFMQHGLSKYRKIEYKS